MLLFFKHFICVCVRACARVCVKNYLETVHMVLQFLIKSALGPEVCSYSEHGD